MPEVTNNTALNIPVEEEREDNRPSAIKVENVSMTFNMASEQLNNLKEYFLALVKHKLFFEELKALQNISLDVKKGDVFGIVGTNGSGKSTLLKIVAGVLEPSEGTVEINGSIAPLIELGAGFDMELSARENIYLNGALLGYSKEFIDEHFDEIVEFSEVQKFLDMPMKNYSSGMIARIAFAIATVIVPEILIVDEVLSVGDFMFQRKCEERIMNLIKNHNTTVLIVSHSNDQVRRLCNKAIWIEKGKTRMIGDAETVCDIYGQVGGRVGSAEAEAKILEVSEATKDIDPAPAFIAKGNNFSEVSLSFAKHLGQKEIKDVILCSHTAIISTSCANALAKAKHAPILTISDEIVDFHVIDWLEDVKPENIYILNAVGKPAPRQLAKNDFSWKPNIYLWDENTSAFELSEGVYNFTKETAKYGKTAILANIEGDLSIAHQLSGYAYANSCAFFYVDHLEREHPHGYVEKIKKLGIEKVICVGKDVTDASKDVLEAEGIETISILNPQEALEFTSSKLINYGEVIVLPETLSVYAYSPSAGVYSATKNAPIMTINDKDLDSIVAGINFIQEKKIHKLVFIDGSDALSDSTMDILARAAAQNS